MAYALEWLTVDSRFLPVMVGRITVSLRKAGSRPQGNWSLAELYKWRKPSKAVSGFIVPGGVYMEGKRTPSSKRLLNHVRVVTGDPVEMYR